MYKVTRPVFVDPILWIVEPVRVRHRVQMVQVTEKFVEAVHRWQELVQVTQVVLAKLPGFIAERLEHGGQRYGLIGYPDVCAGLANRRQSGADRQLAGDEVGTPGCAARLGVIIGEHHTLRGEAVEVWGLARHDAAAVGTDIEPADIVAHDH